MLKFKKVVIRRCFLVPFTIHVAMSSWLLYTLVAIHTKRLRGAIFMCMSFSKMLKFKSNYHKDHTIETLSPPPLHKSKILNIKAQDIMLNPQNKTIGNKLCLILHITIFLYLGMLKFLEWWMPKLLKFVVLTPRQQILNICKLF